eukprot:IDg3329t1
MHVEGHLLDSLPRIKALSVFVDEISASTDFAQIHYNSETKPGFRILGQIEHAVFEL